MIKRMQGAVSGESSQDKDSFIAVLRDSLTDLQEIKKEVKRISNVGSGIAAGVFYQGIEDLRHLVREPYSAKPIRSTLEVCKPSLTHLFDDDEDPIEKALEAAKHRPYQAAPYRPLPPLTAPRRLRLLSTALPALRRGATIRRSLIRSPTRKRTTTGPREKATALPPRRGRARRRSESFKRGRGGGPGLSVPSPDASPCPRPTTIWRSGANCATSLCSGRRCWIPSLTFSKPWKATIRLSRLLLRFLARESDS
jgi:hypothetical protein